ncbi:MAG TPA: metallophosphoesterase family protein [Pirellulales bacterium]
MTAFDRRRFLGSSLTGVAALASGADLFGADKKASEKDDGKSKKEPSKKESSSSAPWRDSLFLTWQRDPTTTITIQWIAPSAKATPAVQFAPLDGMIWRPAATITKPFVGTDLLVHRCELTGLVPGTEYKFQVGSDKHEHRFRTMPAKMTNDFSFVSGGDSGVNSHAEATNRLAARQSPHFVLLDGDLAYDNGKAPDVFLGFVKNYSRDMIDPQGRMIPLIPGIGNHEVNGSYGAKRAGATSYLSVFDGLYPEKTYTALDFGDYLSLVTLDTGHIEPIAGEQTAWLEKTLADRQERSHLIVAGHVPAYPSYRALDTSEKEKGTGIEQRKHWCPLFERYNVDFVLEHHDHTFKRTHPLLDGRPDKNGIVYLGDGSWGKLRAPKTPEERPYLAKVSHAYHMTLHRFEGDQRFHIAMEESGRIADVCTTFGKRATRG